MNLMGMREGQWDHTETREPTQCLQQNSHFLHCWTSAVSQRMENALAKHSQMLPSSVPPDKQEVTIMHKQGIWQELCNIIHITTL